MNLLCSSAEGLLYKSAQGAGEPVGRVLTQLLGEEVVKESVPEEMTSEQWKC